jgi:hypothetical protein
MALTAHESDFISRLQTLAADALVLRSRIEFELALYNGDGFGAGITDADFLSVPSLEHLTQSKMWNVVAALETLHGVIEDLDIAPALDLVKFKA